MNKYFPTEKETEDYRITIQRYSDAQKAKEKSNICMCWLCQVGEITYEDKTL